MSTILLTVTNGQKKPKREILTIRISITCMKTAGFPTNLRRHMPEIFPEAAPGNFHLVRRMPKMGDDSFP
jgi:hypothetical protein